MPFYKQPLALTVLLFVGCLTVGIVEPTYAQVAEQDRAALIALYLATTVDEPWDHQYGFSQAIDNDPDNDVPVEQWQTTDPLEVVGGRIVYVDLYGNNLNGTLPDEICNMDALRELDLALNKLRGPIPSCIGNMAALTKLDIAGLGRFGNKMTGSLPESLSELANLEILDLQFNELTGSIPASLGDAVNLKELRLNNNELTGSIPSSLGEMGDLQIVRLFSNQLTGSIPESLGALNNLQELHLSNNQLTGPLPTSLGDLAALQVLDLHVNQLTGTIPATLGNLGLLTKLDLGGNQLSGTVPAALGNLSSLQDFSLGGNALTDFEPGSYAGWSGLRFQVSSNQLANLPPLNGPSAAYVTRNRLSFADLEPVVQLGLGDDFLYGNQQPTIDVRQTIEDGAVVLSVEEDGAATMYQWQRRDANAGQWIPVSGATDRSFTPAEAASYRCVLTNPLLPDLTLASSAASLEGPVIIVNSVGDAEDADVNDGVCDTGDIIDRDGQDEPECTLRAAMQTVNTSDNTLPPRIAFDIPGAALPTIATGEDLPPIEQPVIIDGTTQEAGSVLIRGSGNGNGLVVHTGGSGSTIKGLIVSGFIVGIGLLDAGNNTVEKNALAENTTGVAIEGTVASSDNIVRDNVIGLNRSSGVFLAGAVYDNIIVGNYIGTERDGRSPLENEVGVWIAQLGNVEKPRGNILRNNVISANEKQGVLMQGVGVGTRIESNKIGVNQAGTQMLSNEQEGIRLKQASGVEIRNNVIAGNLGAGVRWDDSERIELIGNYIGTNEDGLVGLGNNDAGILAFNAVHITIRDNVIAANFDSGIRLGTSSDCTIQHNWIGTDPVGRVLGNGAHGVLLEESPCQVGYDNTIAHNQESGLFLRDVEHAFISRNTVVDNLTGLTVLRGGRSIISFNAFSQNHRHVDVIEAKKLIFWYNEYTGGLGAGTGIHLTASSATIEGNLITDDAGDAITMEHGSTATVTGNNLFGNAEMGLNNLTPSVVVTATGNWWGDASGPGGEGPGTGDAISASVDVSGWLNEMVAVVVAGEADEMLLPAGEADTVFVFVQNWQQRTDALDLTITDTKGWLQSTAALTVSLNGTTGAAAPLAFAVPATTPNGTTSTVEVTATSQADASHTATTTFTLIAESAALAQVLVLPGTAEVAPGDTVLFDVLGLDQFSRTVAITPAWSATGGEIDENGVYVAGSATGEFIVTATDPISGLSGTARVGNGVAVAVEEEADMPGAFHLAPNYPNPFNPETTIAYTVLQQAHVRLSVYDMLGREVAVLLDAVRPTGTHTTRFDASALPSGVYIYRMQAGTFSQIRTMVLLR